MNVPQRIVDLVLGALCQFEALFSLDSFGRITIRLRRLYLATSLVLFDENKEITKMVIIGADKKRKFSVQPVDSKGRPAQLDGIATWSVTPEGAVSLFPSDDGLSCDIVWMGPSAGCVVTVTADADLGGGVREISATADVQTLGPEAATFTMVVGTEVDA